MKIILKARETLRKYLKVIIVLLVVAAISIGLFLILKHFGLTDINLLRGWIKSTGPWGILVYILLRIVCTVFLSFMPATSMIFDLLSLAAFDYLNPFLIYLICFTSVVLTSICMDLLGRYGGAKLAAKILGKEEYEEASRLVQEKGLVYVPIMYLLPIFPDDAICMICGTSKMNFFVHLIEIILFRGVACFTVIFGVQIIPPEITSFTSKDPMDYIRVLTFIIAYLILILVFARSLDKYLSKKFKKDK
ncbi:MAG TPA: TVP38/TMEM64 family protein [Erysipelotrichaceae bacterium]|nr:TVP38/TMEM64 family protein [Erysipelotrichaceae bacterium]